MSGVPKSPYRSSGGNPHIHYQRNLHRPNWPCETDLMLTMTISWTEIDSKDTHRRYFGRLWGNGFPVEIPVQTASGSESLTTYITTYTNTTGTTPVFYGTTYIIGYRDYASWWWGEGGANFDIGADRHATDVAGQNDNWCSSGGMRFRRLALAPGTYAPSTSTVPYSGSFCSFGIWGIQERASTFPDYFTGLAVNGSTTNEVSAFQGCSAFDVHIPDPGTFTTNTTAIESVHTNSITINDGATVSWTATDPSALGWNT